LFIHHILPSILGTIIVYATLTVPTAILSEAFLSFLGIGIREPLPSWGNLAADGLSQLNTVNSRWWLLLWPCLMIAMTLVVINYAGQHLRFKVDPKHA
jgi:ABC-type dipeptide/oligopeptide/nickel transport system permease subunit